MLTSHQVVEAVQELKTQPFNLVILGASLDLPEAIAVISTAKGLERPLPVLSFTPGVSDSVDVVLNTLERPNLLLKAAGELIMRNHGHPELTGKLVVYADAERHLIHVTDDVCRLLDYTREELIGMRIEEISEAPTPTVEEMFRKYVQDGDQAGLYVLKNSSGEKILIRYQAQVLEDSCMVSTWEVVRRL